MGYDLLTVKDMLDEGIHEINLETATEILSQENFKNSLKAKVKKNKHVLPPINKKQYISYEEYEPEEIGEGEIDLHLPKIIQLKQKNSIKNIM